VDTPGFCDTDGPAQDACNLLSIDTFKRNFYISGCYPNVILLVIQATDTRFSGKNSDFMKSLKAFAKLNLVHKERPNVVVVITWAYAIPSNNIEKWKEKMEAKSLEIKGVVLKTLKVEAPVVLIENEFEDNGLPKTSDGEQSKLPDGTLQPKNLYLAITEVLKEAKDDLGLMAVKKFFGESLSKHISPKIGSSTLAKIAASENLSSKEMEIMHKLIEETTEGSQLPEVDTNINDKILLTLWGWLKNVFSSKYLFIAISRAKMSSV